jgi:hypothetical protein
VQIGKNKLECFRYGCSKQKVEAQAQKLQGMKSGSCFFWQAHQHPKICPPHAHKQTQNSKLLEFEHSALTTTANSSFAPRISRNSRKQPTTTTTTQKLVQTPKNLHI